MNASLDNKYSKYHAHIYFDADSAGRARKLCETAGREYGVSVGKFHEKLVGPHPHWSCQLAFDYMKFDGLVTWLEENRGDLSVMIHGVTGDDMEDHTRHVSWLGEPSPLNLDAFED